MIKFLFLCVPILVQLDNCCCQIIKDYASLYDSYPIHKHLNDVDLLKLFNTRDPSQIGRYDLVKVVDDVRDNLDNDQDAADRVLTIEGVQNHNNSVKYIISLKKNKHLIHEDLKDHRHLENCLFLGSVIYPGEGGNAALSNCEENGYSGLIQLHGKKVKLHALPTYLIPNSSLIHLMQESNEDEQTGLGPAFRFTRTKRQISNEILYMELNVAIDKHFEANFPRSYRILKAFAYLNQVQGIYLHPSLGRKMYIFIKKFEISRMDFEGVTNIITYLNRFCTQQTNLPRIDNSIFLSGKSLSINGDNRIVGIAWVGGTCISDYRCGIIEDLGSLTAEIIAHEIGHNIGMDHDCKGKGCSRNCDILGLMAPVLNGKTKFSTCAVEDFESLRQSNRFRCLNNYPKDQKFNQRLTETMQGRFSLDALCDYYFPGSKATKNPLSSLNNPCRKLHCKLRKGKVKVAPRPAFRGMRCDLTSKQAFICDQKKRCMRATKTSEQINDESVSGRKKQFAENEMSCTEKYWECNCGEDNSVDKVSCIKVCGGCVEVFSNDKCSSPMPQPNSQYCKNQCRN